MTEQKNPTVKDEKKKEFKSDFLTEIEKDKDSYDKARMMAARDDRNAPRDEFDGLPYLEAYDRDNKSMLAFVPKVLNEGENPVSTGTTRQSAMSLLSRATAYNYETEFMVFDKTNMELSAVGRGLEVGVRHVNYLDKETDKIKEAVNELLGHGDIFRYVDWITEMRPKKSRPKFNGKVKGVNWTERLEVFFEGIKSRVVQGRRMYVGDIFTSGLDEQPFVFEVNHMPYAKAKMIMGEWERWKYVPVKTSKSDEDWSNYAEDWSLENGPEGTLEVTLLVDLPNNEMQIHAGGVPMLPAGFPTKWEHDKYPWSHEGLEPTRTGFFYSRSFVRTLQNMQDIENDIWRVLIMLAWKAAMPALANNTGQIITRKQVGAGEILDVDADFLKPINDGTMANTNFVQNMASEIRNNMVNRSVPETKQGVAMQGTPTATETTQLNKEAEIAISTALSAVSASISKTDWLKAGLLLQYAMKKEYRAVAPSEGGVVRHVVEVVEELETSRQIADKEDGLEKETGKKHKIFQLKDGVRNIIDRIEARAVPKPRASSALDKVEVQNLAQAMFNIFGQDISKEYLEENFRRAFRIPSDVKIINENPMPQVQEGSKPKPPAPLPNQLVGNDTVI